MYIVKYKGIFGFIKPFSSLRDITTRSSFFIPPSSLEGMEERIFGNVSGKILKYKLDFSGTNKNQEAIKNKLTANNKGKINKISTSILNRIVLVNPVLYLAFENKEDAEKALGCQVYAEMKI